MVVGCLAPAALAALLVAPPISPLEEPIVEAAALVDSTENAACLRALLRTRPYTDESLPRVGGNAPSRFFRSNYVRELPVVGNALRDAIDEYEKSRRYDVTGLSGMGVYYDQARSAAVADLDYLDLLRNSWLDALQDLDAQLGAEDEPEDVAQALNAARRAAHDYLAAAEIRAREAPTTASASLLPEACSGLRPPPPQR